MTKETSPATYKETKSNDERLRLPVLIISGVIFLTNISILVFGLTRTEAGKSVIIGVTAIIFIAFISALRGSLLPARFLTPFFVFLGMTYFLASGMGVRHPAIIGFPAIVILAGLFLGQYGAAVYGVLTTLVIGIIGYAELAGLFVVNYSPLFAQLPIDASIYWILNLTSALIIFFTVRLLNQTINEVSSNSSMLRKANQELFVLHKKLNERIIERTSTLEYRAKQLTTIAQVAHNALVFRSMDALLKNVTLLISEKFNYYHTGVFLLDDKGEYAIKVR